MLVLLYIAALRWYFFSAKRRQKRASYRPAGRRGNALADNRVDEPRPDAGYERGPDKITENTPFLKRARTEETSGGNGVGASHGHGSGLSENDAQVVESYRNAALRGSPEGQVNLGYAYCLGLGVKKDYRQAVRWLEQAAASGDTQGKADLAWLLATCPDGRIRNGQRAIEVLGPVADGGGGDPVLLDILASAYAEVGSFPDAIRLVTEAMGKVDRTSEVALYGRMAQRLHLYRQGTALCERPEETDPEERPDDDEGENSREAFTAPSKGRRTSPADPVKAGTRDDPAQSSRKDKTTGKPMQAVGPKEKLISKKPVQRVRPREKLISKAAAAPSSRPAKRIEAQSLPGAAEAKAMLAALEKPAVPPEKPAVPPSRPVEPKAVSPSEKRIRSTDAVGLPEEQPRKQPAPEQPAMKTAPSMDRQGALDMSNLIVGALMSGKYEEIYAAMSRTYRDVVHEDAIGTMIEQMAAVSGGRMVAAELAGDEAGFYREAGGEETAKHTFRYSVRTTDNKEARAFFVEIVREGDRPACADFFYATPSAGIAQASGNTAA
jgi:hypothetical protein